MKPFVFTHISEFEYMLLMHTACLHYHKITEEVNKAQARPRQTKTPVARALRSGGEGHVVCRWRGFWLPVRAGKGSLAIDHANSPSAATSCPKETSNPNFNFFFSRLRTHTELEIFGQVHNLRELPHGDPETLEIH